LFFLLYRHNQAVSYNIPKVNVFIFQIYFYWNTIHSSNVDNFAFKSWLSYLNYLVRNQTFQLKTVPLVRGYFMKVRYYDRNNTILLKAYNARKIRVFTFQEVVHKDKLPDKTFFESVFFTYVSHLVHSFKCPFCHS
jgi:hypothetical protein